MFSRQWMCLEPMFADPDVKNQLVVENKKFHAIERQWKRITKLALNKPWVRRWFHDSWSTIRGIIWMGGRVYSGHWDGQGFFFYSGGRRSWLITDNN